jgi:hypothetical protein
VVSTFYFKRMAGDNKPAKAGNGGKPEATREGAGRANRNRNRCGNRHGTMNTASLPKQTQFEGRVEALKGYIYDCSDNRQAEIFTKMTEEISGYVRQEFGSGGDDIRRAVDHLELPIIDKPSRPASTGDEYDKAEWLGKMRMYQTRMSNLEEGMKRLYNVVYGQCSKIMVQKLMAMEDFEKEIIGKSDGLGLLKAIRQIAFNFESQKFKPHAIQDAIKQFYAFCQCKRMTPQAYLKEFMNNVDVVICCSGTIGTSPRLGILVAHYCQR